MHKDFQCPRRLLVPTDRPAFISLAVWASSLIEMFDSAMSMSGGWHGNPESLSLAYNQGALVAALHGEIDTAYRICHTQLKILSALYISVGTPLYIELSIQPWVNIARAHRINKEPDIALQVLRMISGCSLGDLTFEGSILTQRSAWTHMQEDNDVVKDQLAKLIASEVVKTLLASERYSDTIEYIMSDDSETIPRVLAAEALAISLCGLEKPNIGLKILDGFSAGHDAGAELAIQLRKFDLLLVSDEARLASELAEHLYNSYLANENDLSSPSKNDLRRTLSTVMQRVGMYKSSYITARRYSEICSMLTDEPGMYDGAILLSTITYDERERLTCLATANEIANASDYASIRPLSARTANDTSVGTVALKNLYRRLGETLP